MAKKKVSRERFNWELVDITVSKTPSVPRNLKPIVANAPKGDAKIGRYLLKLLKKGTISSDEVNFLLASRIFD